jgi:RNA polymerase subunit RPABC4/transcription elongation factor Spt4
MTSSTERTVLTAVVVVVVLFIFLNILSFFFGGSHVHSLFHHTGVPTVISLSILPLILLAVLIVMMIWVYRDAESRGMNGALWALLIFVGNVVGLIIYLIVRNDHDLIAATNQQLQTYREKTVTCSNCSKAVSEKFDFCPHCGSALKSVCPSCGKRVESDWTVCPYCAEKLSKE